MKGFWCIKISNGASEANRVYITINEGGEKGIVFSYIRFSKYFCKKMNTFNKNTIYIAFGWKDKIKWRRKFITW